MYVCVCEGVGCSLFVCVRVCVHMPCHAPPFPSLFPHAAPVIAHGALASDTPHASVPPFRRDICFLFKFLPLPLSSVAPICASFDCPPHARHCDRGSPTQYMEPQRREGGGTYRYIHAGQGRMVGMDLLGTEHKKEKLVNNAEHFSSSASSF